MLKSYLPALIFILLGLATGGAFAFLNKVLGPSTRLRNTKAPPVISPRRMKMRAGR